MNKAPCKNCPNRKVGCHSTCQKYLDFRKEVDKINKIKFAEKEQRRLIAEHNFALSKRTKN
jgi:hypothetical protein